MLSKTEFKILKLLFKDLTKEFTIRKISLDLDLPYPQIHRSVGSLFKKELVKKKQQGKSWIINLVLEELIEVQVLGFQIKQFKKKKDILKIEDPVLI